MGPVEAITTCLRKSFRFSGRASRSEFWWFAPWYWLAVVAGMASDTPRWFTSAVFDLTSLVFSREKVLAYIFIALFVLPIPAYAAMTRRLRDGGVPARLMLTLPFYVALGVILVPLIDRSHFGIRHPNLLLPEAMYAFTGFLGLLLIGCLLCLLPTSKSGPNPIEVTP